MKRFLFILSLTGLLILRVQIFAQQDFNSLALFGNTSVNERGYQVITDTSGNKYLAGITTGTTIIDTAIVSNTSFIAKLKSDNKLIWIVRFNSTGYTTSKPYNMEIDKNGDLVVMGYMPRDSALHVKDSINTSMGTGYLFKLSKTGNVLFTRRMYWNSQQFSIYQDMNIDSENNIYVCGKYRGSNDGRSKVGLSKYSSTGSMLFVNSYDKFMGYGLTIDNSNNVFVIGQSDTNILTLAGVYISKFNNSGTQLWMRKYGKNCKGDKLFYNKVTGSMFLSGKFYGDSINFGNGIVVRKASTGETGFIGKIDPLNGSVIWAKSISTNALIAYEDQASGTPTEIKYGRIHLVADKSDNLYVSTNYNNIVYFTTNDSLKVTTNSRPEMFLTFYNSIGEFQMAKSFGDAGQYNYCTDMSLDKNENIHLTGYYNNALYNNFVSGTYSLKGSSGSDIFITSFGQLITTIKENKNNSESSIKIYPNPVIDENLTVTGKNIESLEIVNMLGTTVVKESNINTFSININVSDLPSGIYILIINNKETKRLIK